VRSSPLEIRTRKADRVLREFVPTAAYFETGTVIVSRPIQPPDSNLHDVLPYAGCEPERDRDGNPESPSE
jgi:hypothetical protein